jgi:hypothetical protein
MNILSNARELARTLALSGVLVGCSVYDGALVKPSRAAATQEDDAGVPHDRAADGSDDAGDAVAPSCTSTDSPAGCVRIDAGCDEARCEPELDASMVTDVETQPSVPDACPNDPNKTAPGVCGCGVRDVDSDRDGTLNCLDACPDDAAKTAIGLCGCGRADTDSDDDGTVDCLDACPRDPRKTAIGACGCGAPDTDSDGDETPDCIDACPADAAKTHPGACGCGAREASDAKAGELYCAKALLLHRYSFDASGVAAIDSIAAADGSILGGAQAVQAAGALALGGDLGSGYANEAYVNLPASVWTGLTNATFECWFTWKGAGSVGASAWQRVFDFGTQANGVGRKYLYLTPEAKGGVRTAFSLNGNGTDEVSVVSPQPAPLAVLQHVAVVIDQAASTLTLYVNGVAQGSARLPGTLADIAPSNLWLGRSNFRNDPAFFGSLLEFRIYGTALTSKQVQASAALGPDYNFQP